MRQILAIAIVGSFLRPAAAAQQTAGAQNVETIQVLRSVRLSRATATDYCAQRRTGFPTPTFEDQYDFKAVAVRSTDGLVTNVSGPTVGHGHACFGATADSLTVRFYADGELDGVRFTGHGDCRSAGRDIPEPGITPWRCYLDLTGLSSGFVGGQLTSNTVFSRAAVGDFSDPVGYTQASIATVRLWKRR